MTALEPQDFVRIHKHDLADLHAEIERLRKKLEVEQQTVADLEHDMARMLETINELENEQR